MENMKIFFFDFVSIGGAELMKNGQSWRTIRVMQLCSGEMGYCILFVGIYLTAQHTASLGKRKRPRMKSAVFCSLFIVLLLQGWEARMIVLASSEEILAAASESCRLFFFLGFTTREVSFRLLRKQTQEILWAS